MLDWLIIGGGFHGTAISFYLTQRKGVARDRLRVLDPHTQPLALWHHFTRNVGMAYLRSPYVHHLHYDPWSLRTFAATRRGEPLAAYIPKFNRPALGLLNAYHDWLMGHYALDALRLTGRAIGLGRVHGGWRVETDAGALDARRVVLAMGNSEQRNIPAWAQGLPNTQHIFDPAFKRADLPDGAHLVIGGGISAAQTALILATNDANTVTLLRRHTRLNSDFDADPCWVTALCLEDFHAEADPLARRRMILAARRPGSLPPDVARDLDTAVSRGQIQVVEGEVATTQTTASLHLTLADGVELSADHIILGTGFTRARPGEAWLDAAIQAHGLPLAPDGYPLVTPTLCWLDGLHVTGPLAELQVGPVARNFIGARLAAERIGQAVE